LRATKVKELLWIYVLASVVFGLFALLLLFPVHPISLAGWFLCFASTLPIVLVGEYVVSILFNNRTGLAVDTDSDHVSMTRIAYGVFVAIALMLAMLVVASEFDLLSSAFWDRHISRNW